MSDDNWYLFPGVELPINQPRSGTTVHYHQYGESCNEKCYGVVSNERARTINGTIIGRGV